MDYKRPQLVQYLKDQFRLDWDGIHGANHWARVLYHSRQIASATGQTSVELRAMQSRSFDTNDKQKTMRTVIATLQDLGFVVDKADLDLGSISATKLSGYALRVTVNVRPGASGKNMIVRANAQYNVTPVTDPKPYQDFFVSLQKSMFLTANNVD